MTNTSPFVSIIVPCRNEQKFVSKCLDSIIAQDYPKDKREGKIINALKDAVMLQDSLLKTEVLIS